MSLRNIYVVGKDIGFANWMDGNIVFKMEEADFVVFTGGEDISPGLYRDVRHPATWSTLSRDKFEIKEFKKAQSLQLPSVGICRGAQLLCVLAGGKLIQDQCNANTVHLVKLYNGGNIILNSFHHQAQYPYLLPECEYKLLGWTNSQSSHHRNGKNEELSLPAGKEAEIVYYPKINALGIQAHPEILMKDYDKIKYCRDAIDYLRVLLDQFLLQGLD